MNVFRGWSRSSYIVFLLGIIFIFPMSVIVNGYGIISIISLIGSLSGFLSVVLIVNKNKYAGYVGIISAIIYMFVSWSLGNYSDTLLNILFIAFLNLPLIFNKNYSGDVESKTIKKNPEYKVYLIAIFISVYAVLYATEVLYFHAPRPFYSVLAATLGITASIATSFFVLRESFVLWGLQNIFQVLLWGVTFYQTQSGIALLMMITYVFYTVNASTAFYNGKWYKNE